jgi:hypothetical protein
MSDDESSGGLADIARSVLDEAPADDSPVPSRSTHLHAVQLSTLLASLRVVNADAPSLSADALRSLTRATQRLVDDLELAGRGPTTAVLSDSSFSEIYRVLTFTLLTVQHSQHIQAPRYIRDEFRIPHTQPSAILRDLKAQRRRLGGGTADDMDSAKALVLVAEHEVAKPEVTDLAAQNMRLRKKLRELKG